MSGESARTPRVEVSPAAPEQAPVLANLLELYSHDLSKYFDLRVGPDGRFGYPLLPLYWQEETRFPFLVSLDGEICGFALVYRGSRISDDPDVWDMAEFFILRSHRKRGIGAAVAADVWRRFPGRWEVRVLEANVTAMGFWRSAVAAFTASARDDLWIDPQQQRRRVLSFKSLDERLARMEADERSRAG